MADESPRTESADGTSSEFTDSQVDPIPPPSEPARSDRRRGALGDVWLVIAVYFLRNTYSAVEGWFHPQAPIPLAWSESSLSVTSVGFAALGIYLITRSGEPPATFGLVRPRVSDLFLGGLLCGLMFVVAGLCAYLMPSNMFGVQGREAEQLWLSPRTAVDYALVAVAYCLNGLSEEVMVRAYFQTRLEHLTNAPVWSVIVTAVLFCCYHAYYGPAGMVYVFAIGLLLGGYFRLTRRLWAVVIAHGIYDLLCML